MSDLVTLFILLAILGASFTFWKLSQIKMRGRCLIPLQYRIIASLAILLVIPAILLLGIAIAIIIAVGIIITIIFFVINLFKVR